MPDTSVLSTMLTNVINYGYERKSFPTRVGNLFIDRLMPFPVSDPGVLEDLKHFEQSDCLGFEEVEPLRKATCEFDGLSINELRKAATRAGIKGSFYMKKPEIIKQLEDNNATSI